MQAEFSFDRIQSVEFCVNVRLERARRTSYLIPIDETVQDALKQVLQDTVEVVTPEDGRWSAYELSEKYGSTETLRASLSEASMASILALYVDEGWSINAGALSDPKKINYYFAVFRDKHARKLVAVRQATQFKGAFKGRFLSVFDNTLRMIPDKVFKLDDKFDFLITKQHVYILHPLAFDRIAEIEEYASARAHHLTLALGTAVKFMDFTELAEFVAGHKRAARLVSALTSRNDLRSIKTALFIKAAHETGVKLKRTGTKIVPDKGSELGCLEMLDDRRYTTALRSGAKPAFVASGRRRI